MSASTKSVHADDDGLMNTGAIDAKCALTAATVPGEVVKASLPCFQTPQMSSQCIHYVIQWVSARTVLCDDILYNVMSRCVVCGL